MSKILKKYEKASDAIKTQMRSTWSGVANEDDEGDFFDEFND